MGEWIECATGFNPRLPDGGRHTEPRRSHLGQQVSIHASRMEGDSLHMSLRGAERRFQSTPPGWRATTAGVGAVGLPEFQSTPPGWRATERVEGVESALAVSIHASRMEGDPDAAQYGRIAKRFNPRLPDGGRRLVLYTYLRLLKFQSTPPGWRATFWVCFRFV